MDCTKCNLCPRECGADRTLSHGYCSSGIKVKIARASKHMWEEPCISGENGSGTVFFSGCNLKCVYCQNEKISRGLVGVELSDSQLSDLFLKINDSGVHNINLVTPTHYMVNIINALKPIKKELKIPVVYNCSGYEKAEQIKLCQGIIDIFLTDIKYHSNVLSLKYSSCNNYFEIATKALEQMVAVAGKPVFENGLMKSGVIVRHLILPSHKNDSISIIKTLFEKFGNSDFIFSLMNQYTPMTSCQEYPEINRQLTSLEYKRVTEVFRSTGFKGYIQERDSSSNSFIPDFDDVGEFLSDFIK